MYVECAIPEGQVFGAIDGQLLRQDVSMQDNACLLLVRRIFCANLIPKTRTHKHQISDIRHHPALVAFSLLMLVQHLAARTCLKSAEMSRYCVDVA